LKFSFPKVSLFSRIEPAYCNAIIRHLNKPFWD
jgi:hypothetical protein